MLRFIVRLVTLSLFMFLKAPWAQAQVNVPFEVTKAVQRFHFNGSLLVAQSSNILFEKSYGFIDPAHRVPYGDPKNPIPFLLASASKQFTAALILIEVGRPTDDFGGTFQLSDPITKYFNNAPRAWKNITIASLLTHTSGLGDYLTDKSFAPTTKEHIFSYIMRSSIAKKPGFAYSNSGYFILGMLLEKLHGEGSYPQLLKTEITDFLRMKHTGVYTRGLKVGFNEDNGNENQKSGKDEEVAEKDIDQKNPDSIFAVGNIYSTLDDLFRWERAIFSGKKIISPRSLQIMYTPQPQTMMEMDKATGSIAAYGYGLHLYLIGGKTVAWHTGHLKGCTSIIAHFIEDDITIIALTYQTDEPVRELVNTVAHSIFNLPAIPTPPSHIPLAPQH